MAARAPGGDQRAGDHRGVPVSETKVNALILVKRVMFCAGAPWTATERLVALAVADRMRDGKCWPGVDDIAGRTGCGERTVRRALKALCTGPDRLFDREPRPSNRGRRSDLFTLCANVVTADVQATAREPRLSRQMSGEPGCPPASVTGSPTATVTGEINDLDALPPANVTGGTGHGDRALAVMVAAPTGHSDRAIDEPLIGTAVLNRLKEPPNVARCARPDVLVVALDIATKAIVDAMGADFAKEWTAGVEAVEIAGGVLTVQVPGQGYIARWRTVEPEVIADLHAEGVRSVRYVVARDPFEVEAERLRLVAAWRR
jgi:hypothetical protein